LIALQDKLRTPQIEGEIGGVVSGIHLMGGVKIPLLIIGGVVTNPVGPPTGLFNWKIGIRMADSHTIWGKEILLEDKDERGPIGKSGQTILYRNEDYGLQRRYSQFLLEELLRVGYGNHSKVLILQKHTTKTPL
jgi:hypothetical protein